MTPCLPNIYSGTHPHGVCVCVWHSQALRCLMQRPNRLRAWVVSCLVFGIPAMAVFCGLGAYFYKIYGHQFLHETFLYHATRQDPRHNFSPHFLFTYLYHFAPRDAAGMPMRPDIPIWLNPTAGAPWCMATALLATVWTFTHDLDMSWLLSTIVFVAFNKVSTAQYYVWFLGIFPAVLPGVYDGWGKLQWSAVGSFVLCQLLWLSQAYRLEFLVRRSTAACAKSALSCNQDCLLALLAPLQLSLRCRENRCSRRYGPLAWLS